MITVRAVACGGVGVEPVKPLRLDGEVIEVKVERERQSQIVHLRVKLKFTNTGERPVVLLLGTYGEKTNKRWWILDTTVSRTLTEALDGKPFYISRTGAANSRSFPFWKELRQQLTSSPPSSSVTQTIQPHKTFFKEIKTVIVVHDDERIAAGSRLWLKVFLELWPYNIEPAGTDIQDTPYGESLKQKWQAFGDLELEPILSSPISFDLPPQPSL
jgi:hypothetical protein